MPITATAQSILDSANTGLGLPPSQIGFTSTDQTGRQIITMLNDVGLDLCRAHDWQFLISVATFTGNGVAESFPMPLDFGRAVNQTLWATSERKFVCGPKSPQYWGWLKYGIDAPSSMTDYRYRVIQNTFEIFPTVPDQQEVKFYYINKNWVKDGTTGEMKDTITAGNDIPVFDKRLLSAAIKVRLWGQKGFDTTEVTAEFNFLLASEKGISQGAEVLSLTGGGGHFYIDDMNVPEDSWDV